MVLDDPKQYNYIWLLNLTDIFSCFSSTILINLRPTLIFQDGSRHNIYEEKIDAAFRKVKPQSIGFYTWKVEVLCLFVFILKISGLADDVLHFFSIGSSR